MVIVAGYRFRQNSNGSFFDIYLYDSLSSGAGYAASISEEIEFLFTKVEKILSKCDCENACHKCLKHYRNQNVHGQLDRFAALELLRWGKYNELAPEIPHSRQVKYISQFTDIIEASNYHVDISDDMIIINNNNCSKKLIVYPAMKKEPIDPKAIFVSDAYIKYAKPYAVKKIISK